MQLQLNHKTLIFVSSLILLSILSTSKAGESTLDGEWVAGSWSQVSIKCYQSWICKTPAVITAPGAKITDTPNEGTWGVCAMGSSADPTSCGACVAAKPSTKCKRVVVTKER